jgi:hypothetical protein
VFLNAIRQLGLFTDIMASNVRSPRLPYKVTFCATYKCNFRCEMCNIWKKKSVNEMTPEEVALFFERWPQFSWVHLTGGELFMRRDLDDLVAAIQKSCRSLFLLNFPTTGWFGDKTVQLVERTLARGIGRLMVTISLDGPKALHEEMRGLPGSWDRAIDTYRRLRSIRRSNFQTVVGMTLLTKNADYVEATIEGRKEPEFMTDPHLNIVTSQDITDNLWPGDRRRSTASRAIADHQNGPAPPVHPREPARRSCPCTTRLAVRRFPAARCRRRASSTRTGTCSPARSGTRRSAICASRHSTSESCGIRRGASSCGTT